MPTPSKGPRMGGSPAHERHMLANLANALFEHKAITTTERRAKRLRPVAERLISKAKRGDLAARRQILAQLRRKDIAYILIEELAPKFEGRDGGYTRITKLPNRKGDNAPMALIELVLEPVKPASKAKAESRKAAAKMEAPAPVEETVEVETTGDVETEDQAVEETVEAATPEDVETDDQAVEAAPVALYAGAVRTESTADAPDAEHTIKGNEDSMKYHVPGSRWYDQTVAEVWFATAEEAKAAGFEPAGGEAAQTIE